MIRSAITASRVRGSTAPIEGRDGLTAGVRLAQRRGFEKSRQSDSDFRLLTAQS